MQSHHISSPFHKYLFQFFYYTLSPATTTCDHDDDRKYNRHFLSIGLWSSLCMAKCNLLKRIESDAAAAADALAADDDK